MGVSITKTFYCDICPATFDNGQALRDVVLPARIYSDDGEKFTRGYVKASVCANCLDKFWEISDSNFAVIEKGLRGVKFYPHFENDKKDAPEREFVILGYLDKDPEGK